MNSHEIEKIRRSCPHIKTLGPEESKSSFETLRIKKQPPEKIEILKEGNKSIWICSKADQQQKVFRVSKGHLKQIKTYNAPEKKEEAA
jgi:hypothetical protein